jgi:hypothetical protein
MAEAHRQREKNVDERLRLLFPQYAVELVKATTFILVLGEHSDKFASVAKAEADCFVYDLEKYYDAIVDKINPINYVGQTYSPTTVQLLNNTLMEIGMDLDMVASIPAVVYSSKHAQLIRNRTHFKEIVKQVVNEYIGGDFAGLYAVRQITQEAIDADFSGNFFPMVVYSPDMSLISAANDFAKIGKYIFTVFAGKEADQKSKEFFDSVPNPDKMSVIASLKKIRATIKNKKN